MRIRKAIAVGAAVLVGPLAAAGGVAMASSGAQQDSAPERQSEMSYTDTHRAAAQVSEVDAGKAATTARPGTIVDSHLETEGKGLRWEVKTDDGKQVWEVQVDATSGQVVSNQADE